MRQAVDIDPYRTGGTGFWSAHILLRDLPIPWNRHSVGLKPPQLAASFTSGHACDVAYWDPARTSRARCNWKEIV